MDGIKQECKLCDAIISDENFKEIEDGIKNIFEVLLLKLTLNETQNVICTMCFIRLHAAFNFKSTCLDTHDTIIRYVNFKNPKPIDLKEIHAQEKTTNQEGRLFDVGEVCRLCLQPISSDHKSLQEVSVESIQMYIPEINFTITTNPAICVKCHDALCVHSAFIRDCLNVNRKRNKDVSDVGDIFLSNPSIKVEEIQIKSEKTEDETYFEVPCKLEKERYEEGGTVFYSQNELTNFEESKNLYNIDDLKQANTQSPVAAHKSVLKESVCSDRKAKHQEYHCDKCMYNTRHKKNFTRHRLLHEDPSKVPVFKCDECGYKNIQKDNLKRHQLKHKHPSLVQTYKCSDCAYQSITKSAVDRHELIHKDPSQVQMFECDECDYKSIQKGNLTKHQLRHKDPSKVRMFKCDECDYKSIRKSHLQQHQLRHKDPLEVRKFECDDCDYKSIHKSDLTRHQLTHTRQRVSDKKTERQQRYREQNREKLKLREAERRKRKQNLQIIAEPSTSSNINIIELNKQSTQWSQNIVETGDNTRHFLNAIVNDRKKDRQQRYREQNREKLKLREVERRKRKQNLQIAESSTSSNINRIELNNEEITGANS